MTIYIPEDKITEIKNAADIVEVISEVVYLKKTGKNYVGLCPFHSEKTPSFTVSPQKQIFHCFGCSAGGNVFSFIMKRDGVLFPDAALMLAKRYGIHIPEKTMSPEQKKKINERERLFRVNREAMNFFRRELINSPSGKPALAYLKKRKIKREIIDTFSLGYAPEGWDHLLNFFKKKGMASDVIEKSGLIVERKNKNGFYDRFRGRIIFPIIESSMQVIGFGGRVMDDSLPKYLNSPETPLYNKSRSLYGLHRAKLNCRQSETVYIVEGYFDLLAMHQYGIQNSVATLGTSITPEHVKILRGLIGKDGKVILVFDSDDAGMKASLRSIEIFMRIGVDARIMILPTGYDPDSYLLEFGYESFVNIADAAKNIMPFLMDASIKKHGRSVEGKIRVISEMKETLASIDDRVARSLYVKELAERIGIDEPTVMEKVREVIVRKKSSIKRPVFSSESMVHRSNKESIHVKNREKLQGKWFRLERQIISMMIQFPEILSVINERGVLDLFEDSTLKSMGKILLTCENQPELQHADLINLFKDNAQKNIVAAVAMVEDHWNHKKCLNILARFESIRNKNENSLIEKIKEAEAENNTELLLKLLNKKQKMAVLAEKKKMALLK